jgi:gamma-glutamyltranspeptidase / glutathione hydrolase
MRHITLLVSLIGAAPLVAQQRGEWKASGSHGAVAAGGQGAVDAGISTLKGGGNAADAAAATLLALSVTDGNSYCFGGEVPILVYDAKRGVVEVLVGQGAAPGLTTCEHFVKRGGIPKDGIEAAAVPGSFDAIITLLDRYGTRTFAEVVQPTLALLDRGGKTWHSELAKTIRLMIDAEKESKGDRRRGLRLVADYFYRGPIARQIDEWSKANSGLIRYADLAKHRTPIEDPVTVDYRGHTVCKGGVWTQGPYLLQTLQILEGFDLKKSGHNRPETIHVCIEALKLGLADRDAFYADPYFVDVPLKQLLDPKYAESRRALIDPKHASLVQRPGDPRNGKAILENPDPRVGLGGPAKDTTTCVVADDQGNVVAATPSGFTGALAGKTGIWLGSRLQSFNNWAGHVNCIEPGKRPRITLTPTLVLKDKKPLYAMSVAGGDGQDQTMLQLVINAIDFGMAPAEAVTAPRFGTNHHLGSFRQAAPELGSLSLANGHESGLVKQLEAFGHKVKVSKGSLWAPVMLRIDPKTGMKDAAGDPQARRHAGAY